MTPSLPSFCSAACAGTMPSSPDASIMLLLVAVCTCAILPCAVTSSAVIMTRASLFQDKHGNLHINSTTNQTVYINGVDQAAEIVALKREMAVLKTAVGDSSPPLGLSGTTYYGTVTGCNNMDRFVNVTTVVGSLLFNGCASDANMAGLRGINHVYGDIEIEFNTFTNVDFLSGLSSVSGHLYLTHNSRLANIDGFSKLSSIGVNLVIEDNHSSLKNVNGFSGLTFLGGGLTIRDSALVNLDGLARLPSVGGFLRVIDNGDLTSVNGLSGVKVVYGYVAICGNPKLSSIPSGVRALASGKPYHPTSCMQ